MTAREKAKYYLINSTGLSHEDFDDDEEFQFTPSELVELIINY